MFIYNYRVFDRYNRTVVSLWLRSTDWVMILPREWAGEVSQEDHELARRSPMPFITSCVLISMEKGPGKGLEKGRKEGRSEGLKKGLWKVVQLTLPSKFGAAGGELFRELTKNRTPGQLRSLFQNLLKAETFAEARRLLPGTIF